MDFLGGDSDTDVKFTINANYARKYDKWRQGEELQKLKDRYGDVSSCSESSTSEEEDEYGREWTEDVEMNFLKALSSLKEKNPKIYDKNVRFFEEKAVSDGNESTKKKCDSFYSVGEYQRKMLLEKCGKFSDEECDLQRVSHVDEEHALKNSFQNLMNDSESDKEGNCDGWGTLFKKRVKTEEEMRNEESDYKLWLVGENKNPENQEDERELKGLHDYWSNPDLEEGEQFLRDYILNKRFLEKNIKDNVPTYDEIVHDSDSGLSADETTLEKQEEFERKYNFRFEEPDHEFVKRFPRTLEQSMRKMDRKRKKHRAEVKMRKEAEKMRKQEELKRLKSLKKKEIMDRIKKLQDITGNEKMGFQSKDLEGDFNPEEHDKRMSQLFDANYYGTCKDNEKPEYPELDEELEIENWDSWQGESNIKEELHCEDPGFNMDCEYEPVSNRSNTRQIQRPSYAKRGKKRRQSKFAAAVAKEKPVFDPKAISFEKYVDEYYALDYEDLIGDLPCRFKYRKVVPNDFGLTIEEILAAPDKELNSWVSVKKIMQRRPENVELFDVQAYRKKAKNPNKKQKHLPSLYGEGVEKEDSTDRDTDKEQSSEKNMKNNKKKDIENSILNTKEKRRKKSFGKNVDNLRFRSDKCSMFKNDNVPSGWRRRCRDKSKTSPTDEPQSGKPFNISDIRLKSYGINPKKLRNKLKFGHNKTPCK